MRRRARRQRGTRPVELSETLACSSPALVAALVLYVLLGLVALEAALNWIVGPLFPLVVLYLGPRFVDHVRARRIR